MFKSLLVLCCFSFAIMPLVGCGGSNEPAVVGTAQDVDKYNTPPGAAEEAAAAAAAAAAKGN